MTLFSSPALETSLNYIILLGMLVVPTAILLTIYLIGFLIVNQQLRAEQKINSKLLKFHAIKTWYGAKVIATNTGSEPFFYVSTAIEGLPNSDKNVPIIGPDETVKVACFTTKQIKKAKLNEGTIKVVSRYEDTHGTVWKKVANEEPERLAPKNLTTTK